MARIETDPNYSNPTFPRATAPTDPFKKEDVQQVAAAFSTHVHDGVTMGKAVTPPAGSLSGNTLADGSVTSAKLAPPIDINGYIRTRGGGTIPVGSGPGLEFYWDGTEGVVQSYNRTSNAYLPLYLLALNMQLRTGGNISLSIDSAANVTIAGGLTVTGGFIRTTGFMQIDAGLLYFIDSNSALLSVGGILHYRVPGYHSFELTNGSPNDIFCRTVNAATLTVSGGIATPVNLTMTGTGAITTAAGNLYLRSASGTVIFDAGQVTVSNGGLNASGQIAGSTVQGSVLYVGPAGNNKYLQEASAVAIRYNAGLHSFEGGNVQTSGPGNTVICGSDGHSLGFYANTTAGGPYAWSVVSSQRYKTNLKPITGALQRVLSSAYQAFSYQATPPDDIEPYDSHGFLAESVLTDMPEAVHLDDQGDPLALDYNQPFVLLFAAFREYVAQTDARLDALEGKVAA